MTTPFARAESYIGQNQMRDILFKALAQVREEKDCKVQYIESVGGLGKTFLMQKLPELIESNLDTRIARIIDFSDIETRSGSVLEARIIEGLKKIRKQQWYRFDEAEVTQAFESYQEARASYENERATLTDKTLEQRRAYLRKMFIDCYNTLAEKHILILRFDTAEVLSSEPTESDFLRPFYPSSVKLIADWILGVFPHLKRTLVVICGRPVYGAESLYTICSSESSLDTNRQSLQPLTRDDVINYLEAEFSKDLPREQASAQAHTLAAQAYQQTEGLPLLLACYAQMRRNPHGLPTPEQTIETRDMFETFLISIVLNPIPAYVPFERQVLVYCLYVLAYARRGLTREELLACLRKGGYPEAHTTLTDEQNERLVQVINNLPDVALVKERPGTGLLYLHDEMHRIIDQSGLPDTLGLRKEVLDFLIELTQQDQAEAETVPFATSEGRAARLIALSDRVYYELVRSMNDGYRQYLLGNIRLFTQREPEMALFLHDDFWRWLNFDIERRDPTNVMQRIRPNREQLAPEDKPGHDNRRDKSEELKLSEILCDDAVWVFKYYVAQNNNQEAIEIARLIQQHFKKEIAHDDYFKIDFYLNLGKLLTLLKDAEQREARMLFDDVLKLLSKPPSAINQRFLAARIDYFRGEAYTLSGFLYRNMKQYDLASKDYKNGRICYLAYRNSKAPDLDITEPLAQLTINLAFLLTLQGDFDLAEKLMREIRSPQVFAQLSRDRQALIYNVISIIQVGQNNPEGALTSALKARDLTTQGTSQRVNGQVNLQLGMVRHELIKRSRRLDLEAEQFFKDARDIFDGEPANLRETLLEYGKYLRTVALIYREREEMEQFERTLHRSLELLDQALKDLKRESTEPTIHSVELVREKAFISRLHNDIHQAQQLLAESETTLLTLHELRYAYIIAGSIAFERGQLALMQSQWQAAIEHLAAALTFCLLFSEDNRTVRLFRKLINDSFDDMPDQEVITVKDYLAALAKDQRPKTIIRVNPAPKEETWKKAWEVALQMLGKIRNTTSDARGLELQSEEDHEFTN